MDKTQGYIPQFLTGYNGPRSSTSRAFQLLVRGVGEAKSKYVRKKLTNLVIFCTLTYNDIL